MYLEQPLGHKQEADRFERMIFPYDRAILLTEKQINANAQNANAKIDEDYWREIFRQLGAEAIAENADWLLTVGERDLTLPR